MKTIASNKSFIISLSITFVIYCILFNLILTRSGVSQVGMLGYIPATLFAWKFGLKRGVIAAIFVLVGTSLNFSFFSPPNLIVKPFEPVMGAFFHLVLAAIFGTLSELIYKLKHEIISRQETEAELHKYQQKLEELVKERTTELEQAHVNLRQAEKMEALGQLTGGIVHDFNNMLSGIIGYTDLIKRKYAKNDPKLEEYTNVIFETSERAAELISNLLAFSRKEELHIETIFAFDLITNTIKLLEHSLGKNIIISHDSFDEALIVMGDYTQLQNVFINLAVNARDAMPDGGKLIFSSDVITINKKYASHHPLKLSPGPYIMISVADSGMGIDEETKNKMFEPFFTTKDKDKGTGMGLASAYGTIKSHLGASEVYSEIGKGTTLKIYLPPANENDEEVTKTGVFFGKQSGSVLLIDDEEIMRTIGSEMLSDLGFTVHMCEDGQQGVEYYRDNHKDVTYIILDIMMPNLDGYSCLRELRKINPNAYVILSSGYAIKSLTNDLTKEGASAFIQKPFDTIRLVKAIEMAKLPKVMKVNYPGKEEEALLNKYDDKYLDTD